MVSDEWLKAVKLTARSIRPESTVEVLVGVGGTVVGIVVAVVVVVVGVGVVVVIVDVAAVDVVLWTGRAVPAVVLAALAGGGRVVLAGGVAVVVVAATPVPELQAWDSDSRMMMRQKTPSSLDFIQVFFPPL
jgi:hypothetical protein